MLVKIRKYAAYIFFVALSFVATSEVLAEMTLVPPGGKVDGDYRLNDFVLVAVTISKWVLLLSGALALLAFVYGGFMFILSSGNKNMVEKGKESLIGGIIGLAVVLLAYTAVDYFMKSLGYNEEFGKWYESAPKSN